MPSKALAEVVTSPQVELLSPTRSNSRATRRTLSEHLCMTVIIVRDQCPRVPSRYICRQGTFRNALGIGNGCLHREQKPVESLLLPLRLDREPASPSEVGQGATSMSVDFFFLILNSLGGSPRKRNY